MNKTATSESYSIAEQKLQQLQHCYAELETTRQTERDAYHRLLSGLALASQGQNLELDEKLAQLTQQLTNNQPLDSSTPLFQQIEQLLNDHGRFISLQTAHAKQELTHSCKRLENISGLNGEFKRQLHECSNRIEDNDEGLNGLIAVLSKLSELYRQALDLLSLGKAVARDEVVGFEELKLVQRELASTIHNLLTEFEFDGQYADQIQLERRAVVNAESPAQLLICCTNIIKLVLSAVAEERESSQSFLSTLNHSLTTIHSSLRHSVNSSSQLIDAHKESAQKLRQHVSEISHEVESAHYLGELKEQISSHLGSIFEEIRKQSELGELEQSLNHYLGGMQHKLSELENQAQEYRTRLDEQKTRLFRDSLTELPNRAAYDERIEIECQRARRYSTPLTLAVVDIDYFKRINDNFGHIAGDKTLKVLGQMLNRWLRKTDFIARYGGEEFALLLPENDLPNVKNMLERLCERVAKLPFKFKQQDVRITVSIGAAELRPDDSPESLFERADMALYQAKHNGRNRVELDNSEH